MCEFEVLLRNYFEILFGLLLRYIQPLIYELLIQGVSKVFRHLK